MRDRFATYFQDMPIRVALYGPVFFKPSRRQMNFDSKSVAGTVIRTLLSFLAGMAVSKGWIQAEQVPELLGALAVLLAGVWGVLQKIKAKKTEAEKISLAVLAPTSTTVAQIDEKHAALQAVGEPIEIAR